MAFSSDWLLDRMRLKRRLRIWQGIGIVAACAVVLALAARFDAFGPGDHIARLWVEGVIRDDIARDEAIAALARDDRVQAVIVRINSPGGSVVGGEALYRNLRALADKKPVVAVMGEVAASAGYMTALAADYIVARESTVTGSIGVLMQSANLKGMLEKIGVKPVVIKSSPLKAAPNPMEDMTPAVEEAAEDVILDMYQMFLALVTERRDLAVDEARALSDGRIYTGRQARSNGLIDATGGEEVAHKWLREEKNLPVELEVQDISYGEEDFWGYTESRLLNAFFDKTLIPEGLRLDGLVSVWQPYLNE